MEKIDIVKRLLRVVDRARGGIPQVTVDLLVEAASTIEGLREQLDQKHVTESIQSIQYSYECQGYADCIHGDYPSSECIRKIV